jgi:hypothetical protein
MLKKLLPLLLVTGLTLLFFHQLIFTDKILARGDTYNYFYPYWDVRNEAYRAGELPMWTSDIFMGVPLLANPQLGTYYPPNVLTAPFRAPDAIKISIALHAVIAGLGMMLLYRTTLSASLLPALTASAVFTFGGYIGAHVEQINQLQGLAWMPLLFALYHRMLTRDHPLRDGVLLGMVWALQIFSGHTQTVFVTGVGLGIYGLVTGITQWRTQRTNLSILRAPIMLGVSALIAVLLAMPQLLPTLELTGMSNRGGGFNVQQATAFSLAPNLIGRALLPSYDSPLFGEYVAYLGVVGLGLAVWGVVAMGDRRTNKLSWIVLAVVGLLLALGRFNPLYLVLAELPGFNLFRVPARWLALFALAMAMLAGVGVEALTATLDKVNQRKLRYTMVFLMVFIGGLIILTRFVLQINPSDIYGDPIPQNFSVALWVGALVLLLLLLWIRKPYLAVGAVVIELFLASLALPYNDLTPPEVYLGQRFTISQLLTDQDETVVPGRLLAISRLFFDPGDISVLRDRYDRLGLDAESQFHAFDAVKKQEMLMPNLPMTWGIPTIDGFGGGVLPTMYYTQFTSLLLPENELRTVDGRLGELMAKPMCRGACMPPSNISRLTDLRYIITDKVYDVWYDNIAYDTTVADYWATTTTVDMPDFVFDEVRILHTDPITDMPSQTTPDALYITVTDWDTLDAILQSEHTILAVTLVDSRTDDVFFQLIPSPLRRVLSSDVKVYEFDMPTSARAYIASDVVALPDDWQGHEDALSILRDGKTSVIHGDVEPYSLDDMSQTVEVVEYGDTHVVIDVETTHDAYLILNDAYYPGWQATVNDTPSMVYRANTMFRAVRVPAGSSTVVFSFAPEMWQIALLVGGGAWCVMLVVLGVFMYRKPAR